MNRLFRHTLAATVLIAALGVAGADDVSVKLSGDQEVPAVITSATGTGTISVGADRTVTGVISTEGIMGTAAHIHEAPPGENGPPIITLTRSGDHTWSVPEGSKLTDEQYQAFEAGNLYINVHSAEHQAGEIRAQLSP